MWDGRWGDRRGFTLIELVLVTVLLGIVIAIAVNALTSAKDQAVQVRLESDLRNLATAQELHYEVTLGSGEGAQYSPTLDQLDVQLSPGTVLEMRAGPRGWAARAQKEDRADIVCAIYVGDAEPYPPSVDEGHIECRKD